MDVSFDRFSISTQGSGTSYSVREGEKIERIFKSMPLLNKFTITFNDTEELFAYAYESLTGEVYDNGLGDLDSEQMIIINFFTDRHNPDTFNLPNIK